MKRIPVIIAAAWLLFGALNPTWAETVAGKVVYVFDGDSFAMKVDRRQINVRLFGVDSPEHYQPFSEKAKRKLMALILGDRVAVDVMDKDRYGRLVGRVQLEDGRDAGLEMVRSGLAWWFRAFAPDEALLRQAEEEARRARRGIWASAGPVPPWVWRRTHRN